MQLREIKRDGFTIFAGVAPEAINIPVAGGAHLESLMLEHFDCVPDLLKLPVASGIYLLRDRWWELLHIGLAVNLRRRIAQRMIMNDIPFDVVEIKILPRAVLKDVEYFLISAHRPIYDGSQEKQFRQKRIAAYLRRRARLEKKEKKQSEEISRRLAVARMH